MAAVRPTYFEWRAELEAQAARWRLTTFALGAISAALMALLVWMATRPAPAYFVAAGVGGLTGRLVDAERVPSALIAEFAGQVALTAGNLMPATAEETYRRLRQVMTAALRERLATQAGADLARIRERHLSTSFSLRGTPRVQAEGVGWRCRVEGHRSSWAGGQPLGEEDIVYTLSVVRTTVSEANPTGLAVSDMVVERVEAPTS